MKYVAAPILVIATILSLSSCATENGAQTAAENLPSPWPLIFNDPAGSYTVYQPQCDSWDGHQFTGRSAVAIQPYGQAQPTYGVLQFSAITLVDKSTRTVALADVKVTGTDFPSGNPPAQSYLATVQRVFSKQAPALSLDKLESSLVAVQPPKLDRLLNTPPKVIVAYRPAVLVSIDGPPAWRPVPGTSLERAINTRVLLLKDQSGRCYLHVFDGYLQADSLNDHWTVAAQPPAGAAAAEKQAVDSGQVDLMQGTPDAATHAEPSLRTSAVPDVDVETSPSELITFSGRPEYAAIPGTDLLYASNTSGNVFKLLTDQQNYILISGRWYRAPSLNGPWTFVPSDQLPRDFASIPDSSPKENVKASVAGTPQAEEALIANSIPQSEAVSRTQAMKSPHMDGTMQLAPIAGTPLHYVVNSGTPIIEADPHSWYACQNGVWYAATSVDGPWTVAASVPAVIYTIPYNSPLHYLTYVRVYGSSPQVVYEGYTPGYLGTVVADNGTVVYGTGYDYTPWVGTVWIGPPVTWGCGFDECWTPWWGWGFNCGFGWGCASPGFGWWACAPPFPWWGGFGGWHHFDHDGWRDGDRDDFANSSADFFHQRDRSGQFGRDGWRNHFAADNFGADRRDRGGQARAFGRAYNSRTGQLAGGQWARVQRVYGSAWNPARRSLQPHTSGLVARSYTPGLNTGGFGNNTPWSRGRSPMNSSHYGAPLGNIGRSFTGRTGPSYSPRYGGFARSFQGSPAAARHGSGGLRGSTSGGGWSREGAGSFRGGSAGGAGSFHGGGGFRGGGGGIHGGGGGGHLGGGGRGGGFGGHGDGHSGR